ncbi:hypothetical protein SASPL_147180 [Salvia splendens]|uniref:Uncharacterized protein n=1 Tax=Salvia splendens TaxID=180675 RepID=A0A8X8Z5X0_SALSN|nr:hypothetical protein SASPL_147180 [Salvia splendens]
MRHKSWPCGRLGNAYSRKTSQPPFVAIPMPEQHELPEEEAVGDQISSGNINMNTATAKSVGKKRKARQAVFEKLGEVEGITIAQRYRFCIILRDKPQMLEVFMGMSGPA